MEDTIAPSWISLLPAVTAIVLAFATRQVIFALFSGVVVGAIALAVQSGEWSALSVPGRVLIPALGTEGFAQILLIYLWCLGGLVGLWEKTGGARHFAEWAGHHLVQGPRSALVYSWLVGVVFHQGGTVSTVLAGTTVRPVTDHHRVSHEELSYVVDSTASPVATLIPFNAWPFYVATLVAGTLPLIPDPETGYGFFLASIPLNFYAFFALLSTLLLGLGWLPWMGGAMGRARERARAGKGLDAPGAEPLLLAEGQDAGREPGYTPNLADFCVPLGTLLGVGIASYLIEGKYRVNEAFLGALLAGMVTAKLRGMSLSSLLDGFVSGCSKMTIGAIVLALAVTLGYVAKELGTAQYVVELLAGHLSAMWLPALLTLLCMGIAFATGTSWGTYAVVFPVALPLAYALAPDPMFVKVCFGAVLGGAVFGDQCSPISDTTILSSMFTGCDLMDHVRTQLPLALAAAGLGVLCSTFFAAVALG